jgi:hypothetical protein
MQDTAIRFMVDILLQCRNEMTKTKNPEGRPPKFNSLPELEQKIEKFFQDCDTSGEPYTITGLALALDTNRQTLINYENKDEFFDTIKKAKTKVEQYAEKRLYTGQAAGPIFALKNFGWTDKNETALTGADGGAIKTTSEVRITFVDSGSKDTEGV